MAWSLAAHETTPRSVGLAAGLFTSCSLLSYLTSLALPYGLLRYGHGQGGSDVVQISIWLTAGTSILGALIFALGSPWWSPALMSQILHPRSLLLYILLNISVGVTVVLDAFFVAQGQAGIACVRNTLAAMGKVGGVLLFAKLGSLHTEQLYCCMLVPGAISIVLISPKFMGTSRRLARPQALILKRAFIRFSLKAYPGALLDGAPIFVLPVLTLRLVGPTENAYFYVAWSIAGVVGLLSGVVGQVALREFPASLNRRALAKRAQVLALSATAFAVLVLGAGAGLVLRIFGPDYGNAEVALRLLLLSTLPAAYLTIVIALFRGQKRHRAVNQASISYAVLSLGVTLVAGAKYGLLGVCAGWFLGVTLSAVATFIVAIRQPAEVSATDTDSWLLAGETTDERHAA